MKERDIKILIKKGLLRNELEYERALSADRTLRLLVQDDPTFNDLRKQLRHLIALYEKANWSAESRITDEQLAESDRAEEIVEKERIFIQRRKEIIVGRLNDLGLNQTQLGIILNHSKSYISELLNGIRPFSVADLILIHRLLKIKLDVLFPTTVPLETQKRIKASLEKISLKKHTSRSLKLREGDLQLVRS